MTRKAHRGTLLLLDLHRDEGGPPGCRACANRSVCWGCRASAYYYAGDVTADDPLCWMAKR